MDQDRQGFVEFVEHVHPMRSVYTEIAKTGRGLYTKLNMERGKHFNDLCKNMQGVLTGKQQRKKGRKLKYTQAPPQFQFSYTPRRGTPIAHPTRNRQRSRTRTGVSGDGILRLPWLE